jgi:filamentous hemagglutinin
MNKIEFVSGRSVNIFQNLGTMPPALLVNYGALYDKYRIVGEQAKSNAGVGN